MLKKVFYMNINDIFERMEHGKIDGRIVIDLAL